MSASLTVAETAKPLPEWIRRLQAFSRANRFGSPPAPKAPKPRSPRKPSTSPATASTPTGKVETTVKS